MTLLLGTLTQCLHAALMFAAAPVIVGLMRRTKARLLGRAGPPVLQTWFDLLRLVRKQPVMAENASWLFRAAPAAVLAVIVGAAMLVPSFALGMLTAPIADLLVLAGLLALARCILSLAGMDLGTSFGGIGASRTITFGAIAEPALFLVIFTIALLAGSTNLDAIAGLLRADTVGMRLYLGLALIAVFAVAIIENRRAVGHDPARPCELTMASGAIVLEYSGRDLAMVEGAAALKLLLWLTLLAAVFLPFGLAPARAGPLLWVVGLATWAAKMLGLAVGLAALETFMATMRISRVPELLGIATLLALLAAIFLFASRGMA